ncbi:transcription factor HES-5 [Alligator mississippiensis]|uniref:transcription factor HES-5 n=1 Tax=Alligator mississippiensis TaxID=8496 RepID=UPI0003D0934E|nr:transcription factor HES-5 [Alligator mississippiensis]
MAPNTLALEILTPKEKNRLRKPMVEKLRRDRINSSIEQLKVLLEKEFQRHQPNSKLEKADILEMTVSYLKYSQTFPSSQHLQQDYSEGYSWCLKEALQFLSLHSANLETQTKLLRHFQRSQVAAKDSNSSAASCFSHQAPAKQAVLKPSSSLWRPW